MYTPGISGSRHDVKLNFVPEIPRVKELLWVALLTSSCGGCTNYRPEDNFTDLSNN